MPTELITNRNLTSGFETVFIYVNDITHGVAFKMFLLSIWILMTFGLYFVQKKTTGTADFPQCVAVSSFITAIVTIILGLNITGLVDIATGTVVFIVAIISVVWFLMSKE